MNHKQTDTHLTEFLEALGLELREIEAFRHLLEQGTMTTLELSRSTKIPRTTLYRIIGSLKAKGLVEEIVEEYVAKVQAAPLSRLEYLVAKQKERSDTLISLFPNIEKIVTHAQSVAQADTKVLMYRGREGIRQMIWNVLDAKCEVVGYTYHHLDAFAGKRFMDRFRSEFIKRKLSGRDILSDNYYKSISGRDYQWQQWKSRYMKPNVLNIDHQLDIYNDVTAVYNWHEGEVFGMEIHNKKVAHMQRQIFEIVWNVGRDI